MIIKEIKIKNFRSIEKADITLSEITMFVGMNDVGKSNVLKSLNLFFNNETDYKQDFHFEIDFCKHAVPRVKKADEIIIELIINAPSTYAGVSKKDDKNNVIWKKIWRKGGLHQEIIKLSDNKELPPRSKLNSWLRNLKYNYIPAIRDNLYFESLLSNLHDSLADTIESELKFAGKSFIDRIEANTKSMIDEIDKRLKLKSQIKLPPNLQSLFKTLDFSTVDGNFEISLSNRGDGIKTRYIPVILKFISEQYNFNRTKGSPVINTIWGYEEPENNLEMLASFKLAHDFLDYSKDTQILLSTHSPGFYTLNSTNDIIKLFQVKKDLNSEAKISEIIRREELNETMGVMPLIAPYIKEKIDEIEKLKNNILDLEINIASEEKHILFVEGNDELRIFNKIIKILGKDDIVSISEKMNGCSGVREKIMSRCWINGMEKFKAVGFFDNDSSGKNEYTKLQKEQQYVYALNSGNVKAFIYKPFSHLLNIKKQIKEFSIELEELYPPSVWKIAKENGWLIKRDINELDKIIKLDNINQTKQDKIESFNLTEDELLYIYNKVPDNHKDKLSKYLESLKDDEFLNEINELVVFFEKDVINFLEK